MKNNFTRQIKVTISVTDEEFKHLYEKFFEKREDPFFNEKSNNDIIERVVEDFLNDCADFNSLLEIDWETAWNINAEICEEFTKRFLDEEGE